MCGNAFVWLRAGSLTGGRREEIALDILATPSLGETAWVFRLEGERLRLLRRFSADRVRLAGGRVVLSWLYAARSPDGRSARQVWRFEGGVYRRVG
jgi:hypothetical protein